MYLREMGSVELLSREGEIAIAKRIEAGRETMIAGLCESPLTFQALIIWRDELQRRHDAAARDHRSRSDLFRSGGQGCPAVPEPREDRGRPQALPRKRKRPAAPASGDDDITDVGGEGMPPEEEEEDEDESNLSARRDGSRAAPAGHGNARHHRRDLQEAAQAAGPRRSSSAWLPPARCLPPRSAATRSSGTS